MLFPRLLSGALLALASSSSAFDPMRATASSGPVNGSYCPPYPAPDWEQRQIFNAFIQDFLVKKNFTYVFNTYIAEDYIQHNPYALSGRQAGIDFFKSVDPSTVNFTVLSSGLDTDHAWIHYRMDMQGAAQPFAVADIFRFNGSCIQEHWDVQQQRPADAINPIAMF